MTFMNSDQVLEKMRPILNSCAEYDNGIDGIAFLSNAVIVERSKEVPGKPFDTKRIPSLLRYSETTQELFGEKTNLEYVSFRIKGTDIEKWYAWTLAFLFKGYALAFVGDTQGKEQKFLIHQGTVQEYIKDLSPLIKEYDRLTSGQE